MAVSAPSILCTVRCGESKLSEHTPVLSVASTSFILSELIRKRRRATSIQMLYNLNVLLVLFYETGIYSTSTYIVKAFDPGSAGYEQGAKAYNILDTFKS